MQLDRSGQGAICYEIGISPANWNQPSAYCMAQVPWYFSTMAFTLGRPKPWSRGSGLVVGMWPSWMTTGREVLRTEKKKLSSFSARTSMDRGWGHFSQLALEIPHIDKLFTPQIPAVRQKIGAGIEQVDQFGKCHLTPAGFRRLPNGTEPPVEMPVFQPEFIQTARLLLDYGKLGYAPFLGIFRKGFFIQRFCAHNIRTPGGVLHIDYLVPHRLRIR